jgi:tripartite-type tricarboxylate transporter receptor subunit TctC
MRKVLRPSVALLCAICSALSLLTAAPDVFAQRYPTRPVRMVVPFPPGGGTDVLGRLLAQKMGEFLGQQVIVDNRAGAAGRIGTEYVARAAPDGYTLLMGTTTSIITAPALFSKLPYRSPQDFSPISSVAGSSYLLVVHPSVPARTTRTLIALAKARPGQLNFASSGPGDTNHLSAELFQIEAGIKLVHIPYKGAAPGMLSVVTGETDLMFGNTVPAIPLVKAGKVRALGITSLKRSSLVPDVPTLDESGLRGFDVEPIYMVLGPARMQKDIVARLNADIAKAVRSRDLEERLEASGAPPRLSSPEELEKLIVSGIGMWSSVVKRAHITPPH